MSKIRDSVRLPYTKTVAGSGTGTIRSDIVKVGQTLVCQSIAFRNRSTAGGTASLRIKQMGVTYDLGDQASPAANQWYYYAHPVSVNEGEQIEVSQASCSASDVLDLVIVGYIEFKKDLVKV